MMEEVLKQIAESMKIMAEATKESAAECRLMREMYAARIAANPEAKALAKAIEPQTATTAEPAVVVTAETAPAQTPAVPAAPEMSDAEREAIKQEFKGYGFPALPRLRSASLVKMLATVKDNVANGRPANAGMPGNIVFQGAPAATATVPSPATPAAGVVLGAVAAPSTPSTAQSVPSATPATDDFMDEPKNYTEEDVRNALREYAKAQGAKLKDEKKGVEAAKSVMAKFGGAQRVADIKPEQYAELMKALV